MNFTDDGYHEDSEPYPTPLNATDFRRDRTRPATYCLITRDATSGIIRTQSLYDNRNDAMRDAKRWKFSTDIITQIKPLK